MNDEPRDARLLIGLHKLAEQNGEGLVPELHALMAARTATAAERGNVVEFPIVKRARGAGVASSEAGRVLTFRR